MRFFRICLLVTIALGLSCFWSQNIPPYFNEVVTYLEELEAVQVEQGQRPYESNGEKGIILHADFLINYKLFESQGKEYIKARLLMLLIQTHIAEKDITTAWDKLNLYKNLLDLLYDPGFAELRYRL